VLLAVRACLSIPWPNVDGGQYYWQHGSYVDTDDFPNDAQMILACVGDFRLLYTSQVHVRQIRWTFPGTETVYLETSNSSTRMGELAPQTGYNILIAARWRMRGEDGSYTYHLHRQPVGEDYLIDGVWSDVGYTQQNTRMGTFINQGIYRTPTGSLIAEGEVAQLPVGWQLRHGTKRRNRRCWLPV